MRNMIIRDQEWLTVGPGSTAVSILGPVDCCPAEFCFMGVLL